MADVLSTTRQWIIRLGVSGHSGDESDHRDMNTLRYTILQLEWRSMELTQYLRALDVVHLSTRWTRDGRPKQGRFPRIRRVVNGRVDTSAEAVPGLPRNFYDATWLSLQSPETVLALQISDAVVDLSIPPRIQTYVVRNFCYQMFPDACNQDPPSVHPRDWA